MRKGMLPVMPVMEDGVSGDWEDMIWEGLAEAQFWVNSRSKFTIKWKLATSSQRRLICIDLLL
jgi:hypothetical protein